MTETEYKNLKRGDKLRVNHWLYGFSISGIINLSIEPGTILTFHTKTKFDELMSTNNCISFKEYGKDNKWWCGLIDIYKPMDCPKYLKFHNKNKRDNKS